MLLVGFLTAAASHTFGQATEVLLSADSVAGLPGTEVLLPVRVKGFDNVITGQGTVAFDPKVVELVSIEQHGLSGLDASSFNTAKAASGIILFSWDDVSLSGQSLPDDAILFAIRFKITGTYGASSSINFVNSPTRLEFSNKSFEEADLKLASGKVQVPVYAIKTSSMDASAFCAGSSISVAYTSQGDFPDGNIFSVELSDSRGSFANATTIGSGGVSPIQVSLPADMGEGAGYRIRVSSSAPLVAGSDNGSDLAISFVPAAPVVTGSSSCGPGVLTLSASGAPVGGSYRWYTDANSNRAIHDQKGATYITRIIHTTSTFYVSAVNSLGCESERVPVEAQIYDLNSITAGPDEETCITDAPFIPKGVSPAGGIWSGTGMNDAGLFDPSSVGAGIYTIKYTFTCLNGSIGEASKKVRVIDLEHKPEIKQINADILEVDLIGSEYEWVGNGKVFTSTTNRIKIDEPGFYKVKVLDSACASVDSDIFVASFYSDYVVYPNPSFGTATISGPTLDEALEIEVYNTVGKKVFSKSFRSFTGRERLELYHLSPDMYFMSIRTANTKKIVRFAVAI
ncbi:hypothetical protein ABID22_002663 [Pontibacter aydingkolensis]|uniref:T9SS type A sorting domain-containing protein n=1 Tax=Pontibacter aydingkolensis TaxID=1911536 RepID=A0ABS7CWN4_9BACT|nr:cohesin domain-containing protein [Pontibacter aydingkolensis]MBW7468259.1 T9SS type A sorting domain-containing protein [Pontibacter aydingkolensis]